MAELRVPSVDFSAVAELPGIYRKAQNDAVKRMTLDQLGRGEIDQSTAAQRLLAVDPQAGMSLAQLGNNQRDFQFRQQEAERAQRNADRNFDLQARQIAAANANAAESRRLAREQFEFQREQGLRPEIRLIKDENGNDVLISVDRRTNAATPINVPGRQSEPSNPFMTGGAMNLEQSNAALYASRMLNAEKIFRDPKVVEAGMSVGQRGKAAVPVVGNFLVSDQYQRFDQAKRDFINATLRRESGAAISASEFENAEKQYFPQPGDSKEVLAQKQRNREEAIRGIGAAAGKGYRPSHYFDAQGNIVERGTPRQAGPTQSAAVPPPPPGFQLVK
jgi:hypothetical protein